MVTVQKEGIILEKTNREFESHGVMNPATIQQGEEIHLYYRAVGKGYQSTIGYCRLIGPKMVADRWQRPLMVPESEFEKNGLEDPRIVKIDNKYYLTYTGFDGLNARAALAISDNLFHFTKMGIIAPPITRNEFITGAKTKYQIKERYIGNQIYYLTEKHPDEELMLWDKHAVFFPRRINGQLAFLHRIRPGIQLVKVNSLRDLTWEFWEDYFMHFENHVIMEPEYDHESSYIGSGCPPIETPFGWLLIYHGAEETHQGIVYSACAAALLDLNDQCKVIARLPYTLFKPEFEWKKRGEASNVVFPTGTAKFGDTLYIYYGAANERIAVASVNLPDLVDELLSQC